MKPVTSRWDFKEIKWKWGKQTILWFMASATAAHHLMKMKTMIKLISTGQTSANLHLPYSKNYQGITACTQKHKHQRSLFREKVFMVFHSIFIFLLWLKSHISALQSYASWPPCVGPPLRETPTLRPVWRFKGCWTASIQALRYAFFLLQKENSN